VEAGRWPLASSVRSHAGRVAKTRERRRNRIALLIALVILALVAIMTLRPAYLLGVQPGALARSVQTQLKHAPWVELPSGQKPSCEERADDEFSCLVYDVTDIEGGGGYWHRYRVEASSSGCWAIYPRHGDWTIADDCIWILDY
jgi:hypothetical protein